MALVGNISGSSSYNSNIGVSGSVVIANRPDSLFPTLNSIGGDVVFFVSGSRGGKGNTAERTVSVFGGDAVVSGSLTVGTGSVTITSNDITFSGGAAQIFSGSGGLTLKDSSGQVTVAQIIAGAVTQPSYWTSITANEIFTTGSLVASGSITAKDSSGVIKFAVNGTNGNVSGSGNFSVGGNLTLQGNLIADADEAKSIFAAVTSNTITIGAGTSTLAAVNGTFSSNVVVEGDLTVNGTTTTINTTNLLVEDPIIYFGSGSVGSNRNGGIALASGSSVTNQALVWGRVDNDTWGAGRLDVTNGTVTDLTAMSLLPVRGSKFELGGSTAFVTSSDGTNISITHGSTSTTTFTKSGTPIVQIGDYAGSGEGQIKGVTTANALGPLWITGSDIKIGATGEVAFFNSDIEAGAITPLAAGAGLRLEGKSGTGTSLNLVVSGSELKLGTNSGLLILERQGVPYLTASSNVAFNTLNLTPAAGFLTSNIVNTVSTTVSFAGEATTLNIGNATAAQTVSIGASSTGTSTYNLGSGNTGSGNTKTVNIGTGAAAGATTNVNLGSTTGGTITANTNVLPAADVTYNLGSPGARWQNIYTGDLHLRNDRGDYTLIEEEDFLSIRFNKTGKRYKFVLEAVPELDEK